MKQALVSRGPRVEIVDTDVPTPSPDQVLIKVVASGCNPKDWKMSELYGLGHFNSGDDIAGVVQSVGLGVVEFKPGDRVAAMHQIGSPFGGYGEYAISPADTTFHIPAHVSFEEASTIPLAGLTAAVLLFRGLRLPGACEEEEAITESIPFLVYGGASAVGAFAIQLARHRGIHPIIAVAGYGCAFVEGLISREMGDVVVDYRGGDDQIIMGIQAALKGASLHYALEAVRSNNSSRILAKVMASEPMDGRTPKLALTQLPPGEPGAATTPGSVLAGPISLPATIEPIFLGVSLIHDTGSDRDKEFGFVYSRLLARGLKGGWLKPHPHEVQPGGLNGLETSLGNLKAGRASAIKYVIKLADTPGVQD